MAVIAVLVVVVVYNLLIKANNTELRQDSEAISLQVEKYFSPFERMVKQLALDEDVQTILTTTKAGQKMTENEVYPAVLKKLVAVAGLDTENIQGVFTADLDSNASITSAGGISGDDYDCTTRTWYSCTQTGETKLTKTYVAASTGKTILSAVTPVFDEKDTVVGVVGIDVGLDTVMNMMGNYTIGANGYSMLLTSDGTFVYHPNADLIDTMIQDMNISDNQSEQLLKYKVNGEQKMEDSKKQMAQMREAMDKIQESSKQVVGVIKAIEDIASQTNLLSLNASIEAARAGEAGKGFAVVAGEIGGLADESADAVNTTRNLINVSLDEIEKGNTIVNDVIASLDNAVERVRIANGMIQETAQVADVQMKSIDQIRDGIRDMSQVVSDNSAMAEETSATSEELAAQSVTLNELVQKFELE